MITTTYTPHTATTTAPPDEHDASGSDTGWN